MPSTAERSTSGAALVTSASHALRLHGLHTVPLLSHTQYLVCFPAVSFPDSKTGLGLIPLPFSLTTAHPPKRSISLHLSLHVYLLFSHHSCHRPSPSPSHASPLDSL